MLTLLLLLVLITPPGLVDDGPRRLRHSPPSGTGNCELPAEILQPRAGKEDYLTSVLLSGCSASLAGLSGFCFFYSSRLFFSTLYFCLASISISLHQFCRVPAILVSHLSPGLLDQFWDQSKLQSSKSGLFGAPSFTNASWKSVEILTAYFHHAARRRGRKVVLVRVLFYMNRTISADTKYNLMNI